LACDAAMVISSGGGDDDGGGHGGYDCGVDFAEAPSMIGLCGEARDVVVGRGSLGLERRALVGKSLSAAVAVGGSIEREVERQDVGCIVGDMCRMLACSLLSCVVVVVVAEARFVVALMDIVDIEGGDVLEGNCCSILVLPFLQICVVQDGKLGTERNR